MRSTRRIEHVTSRSRASDLAGRTRNKIDSGWVRQIAASNPTRRGRLRTAWEVCFWTVRLSRPSLEAIRGTPVSAKRARTILKRRRARRRRKLQHVTLLRRWTAAPTVLRGRVDRPSRPRRARVRTVHLCRRIVRPTRQDRYNSNQFRTYRDSVCLANNTKQNAIKRTDVNVAAERESQPTWVSDSCDTDSELLQGSVGLDLSKRRTASKDPKSTAPSDFSRNFARTSNSVGNERRQVSPRPASNFSDGPPLRRCRSPGKKKHLPKRNSSEQQPNLAQFTDFYGPSHDWLAQLARHAPLPGFNYGGLDPYRNALMQLNLQRMLMPPNYDLARPPQFGFDVPMYYPTFGAGDIERNYQMLAEAVHGRRFDLWWIGI